MNLSAIFFGLNTCIWRTDCRFMGSGGGYQPISALSGRWYIATPPPPNFSRSEKFVPSKPALWARRGAPHFLLHSTVGIALRESGLRPYASFVAK